MGREAMLREIAYYSVAVVDLSATVNFGAVTVLKDFDPTLAKAAAVAVAAVAAALVAWFAATRILALVAADFGPGCRAASPSTSAISAPSVIPRVGQSAAGPRNPDEQDQTGRTLA